MIINIVLLNLNLWYFTKYNTRVIILNKYKLLEKKYTNIVIFTSYNLITIYFHTVILYKKKLNIYTFELNLS